MSAGKLQLFGLIGLALSSYALYVEHQSEQDPSYEAMCDINHQVSCSKVFLSEWGHLFSKIGLLPRGNVLDLPNAGFGLIYFSIVLLHRLLPLGTYKAKASAVFYLTIPVIAATLLLAYILATELQDVCVVCVSTYVCNFAILLLSYNAAFANTQSKRKAG